MRKIKKGIIVGVTVVFIALPMFVKSTNAAYTIGTYESEVSKSSLESIEKLGEPNDDDCKRMGGQCKTEGCNVQGDEKYEETNECGNLSSYCCIADSAPASRTDDAIIAPIRGTKASGEVCSSDADCRYGLTCGGDLQGAQKTCLGSSPVSMDESGCCVGGAGNCKASAKSDCSSGSFYNSPCNAISTCTDDVPSAGVITPSYADPFAIPNVGLPDPQGGVKEVLANILRWMLGIVGIVALVGFVVSGIQYVISTGNEAMIESAKRNMLYSIIGIVVVLASFVIIKAINYALEARALF